MSGMGALVTMLNTGKRKEGGTSGMLMTMLNKSNARFSRKSTWGVDLGNMAMPSARRRCPETALREKTCLRIIHVQRERPPWTTISYQLIGSRIITGEHFINFISIY